MRKVLLCLLCFGLLTGCANAPKPSDNNDNDVVIKNEETTTAPETTTTPVTTTVPETTTTTEVTTTTQAPVTTTTPVPETTKAPETTVAPEVTTAPVTTKTPATTTTTKPASSNAIAFEVEDITIIKGTSFDLVPPANVTYDVQSSDPDIAWVKGYNISAGYTGTSTITVTAHQAGYKDTTKKFKVTVELNNEVVYIEPEQREEAEQLFDLINNEREEIGEPRLTWSEELYDMATLRSRDDLPKSYTHSGENFSKQPPLSQELILKTNRGKAKDQLFEFRNSPAHWDSMMNKSDAHRQGINEGAVAVWFDNTTGMYYTTVLVRN